MDTKPRYYSGQLALAAHAFVGKVLKDIDNGADSETVKKFILGHTDKEVLALMVGFNAYLEQVMLLGDSVAAVGIERDLFYQGITAEEAVDVLKTKESSYAT